MLNVLRPFTANHEELPRAVVVTGARGVGKSTFLLHHMGTRRLLYVSADSPLIGDTPLYDVGEHAFMAGYEGIIVDEVHFARDWSTHLKALYDDFPDRAVWVSDSSSLVLRAGGADLSRRFLSMYVPLLSFREYLALHGHALHPPFDPFETVPLNATPDLQHAFRAYRRAGTRPFFGEGYVPERVIAILEKTLQSDVPFFVPQITHGNFRLMNAIVATLAQASVPRLQVRSLCADWGIGADKLYQLLFVMESVGVVRIIRPPNDAKAHTAAMLLEGGRALYATKDERPGDFLVDGSITIEVGGANRDRKRADFVIRDDTDVATGSSLPLWSLGFLY